MSEHAHSTISYLLFLFFLDDPTAFNIQWICLIQTVLQSVNLPAGVLSVQFFNHCLACLKMSAKCEKSHNFDSFSEYFAGIRLTLEFE